MTQSINSTFPIQMADTAAIDAFSRLRVSQPTGIFDSQLTYNLAPLLLEPITSGSGATITHDATNRMALMTFSSTGTGGKAYLQSYEHFRYQPGKSQLILLTFNFKEPMANVLKFVGYSDGTNGIELQQSGSTVQLALLSGTTSGNQTVTQANWNIDKMDGTGESGKTLNLTKTQILGIDLQALYVGRVRVSFDIGGVFVPVHEFIHSNLIAYPYLQTANLPVRCGMTCTGTVSTTMNMICSAVVSEGGVDDTAGFGFSAENNTTASSGTRTHLLSVRPKTTFNSITNRSKIVLESIEIMPTGANPVLWELVLGQAISGATTYSDVNATYSAFEFNTAGTISGSPAIVILTGYVNSGSSAKLSQNTRVPIRYPITLDAAGAVRALGTVSVDVTGLTGTAAVRVALNWKEIR